LRARRGAIDFVNEQKIGKDRTAVQGERAARQVIDIGAEDVGGHQIWSALHALEFQLKDMRQGLYCKSLGQARDAFDQRMPAHQHYQQKLIERFALADNGLAKLGADVSR